MARSASHPPGQAGIALLLALGALTSCAQSDAITGPSEGGGSPSGPGSGGSDPGPGGSGSGGGSSATTTSSSSAASTSTAAGGEGGGTTVGSGGGSTGAGPTCGDGVAEGGEACDGEDLAGATCADQGLDGGSVVCDACALDYSGCAALLACENGVDDDSDGLVDAVDPACTGAGDDDEAVFSPSCDGIGGAVVDLSDASGSPWTRSGATDGAPDAFGAVVTASCPPTPGFERVFRFVVPSVMSLDVSLDNPGTENNWDPVLYVKSASCMGTQIACNDDGDGGTLKSQLQLFDLQPGTYYVFVDSLSEASFGDFELTLTQL